MIHRLKNSKWVPLLMFVELVFFILPTLNFQTLIDELNFGGVLPGVLTVLTNEKRAKNNLSQLKVSPLLTQAAQLKAEDMAQKSYFAHTSPEGKTPWYWFKKVGYKYAYAGENLAVSFTDSNEVTEAWMNSASHKANIVSRFYEEVGTGVATGTLNGQETTFVAQVYAKPRVSKLTATAVEGPNLLESWALSPKSMTDKAMLIILIALLLVFIYEMAIKLRLPHRELITHGFLVAILVIILHLINTYIARENFQTSFMPFEASEVEE